MTTDEKLRANLLAQLATAHRVLGRAEKTEMMLIGLCRTAGVTWKDIAHVLDTTATAVRKRWSRARS